MRKEEVEDQLRLVFLDLCKKFVDFLENSPANFPVTYDVDYVRAEGINSPMSLTDRGLEFKGMHFPAEDYGLEEQFPHIFSDAKKAASDRVKAQRLLADLEVLEKAQETFFKFRNELED